MSESMNALCKFAVCLVGLLALVPVATCDITFGGSGSGNVTLTNPDNSTFTFNSSNQTTYSYAGNANDGWWMFIGGPTDEELDLWVIGAFFGVIAIAVAVALLMVKGREKHE